MIPPLTCADCGAAMPRRKRSNAQGLARCNPCRRANPGPGTQRPSRPDPPGYIRPSVLDSCSSCGAAVARTKTSADAIVCLACRRARRPPPPPETRDCPTCGETFKVGRATQVYCRPEHRKQSPHNRKTSAASRGYGEEHKAERKRWAEHLERVGAVRCHSIQCLKPGVPIRHGDTWHLGHTVDRAGYTGPEHPKCNTTEGARRRHRTARMIAAGKSSEPIAPDFGPTGDRLVVLLCGPPCSGKSSAASLSGLRIYDRDDARWTSEAEFARNLSDLADDPAARAVVLRVAPSSRQRREIAAQIGATHTIMMAAPRSVLNRRAAKRQDGRRSLAALQRWFAAYDHDDGTPVFTGWAEVLGGDVPVRRSA